MKGMVIILTTINPYLRSNVYQHLSAFYQYQEEDFFNSFKAKKQQVAELFKELAAAMSLPLDLDIERFVNSLDNINLLDLQAEYVRLFDYRPACPSFESFFLKSSGHIAYEDDNNPARMQIAIEEFYREYGIEPAHFGEQPPDHITTELEFMYYLTFCEGEKQKTEQAGKNYLAAQSDFMQEHLILWVPKFCEIMEKNAQLEFYRLLSTITRNFVSRDASYLYSSMEGCTC